MDCGVFDVIGRYADGESGLNAIKEFSPQVVILDIILPERDGISVLEEYKRLDVNPDTIFIILTAVAQENILRRTLEAGADYVILKPFSLEILSKRILEQLESKQNFQPSEIQFIPSLKKSKDGYITDVLTKTGIPVNLKGYNYIKTAILLCLEDASLLESITKLLYPTVAKKCGTTPSRIERDIRHCLEVAWSRGNGEFYYDFIGFDTTRKNKPTNGAYISSVVEKARVYFS